MTISLGQIFVIVLLGLILFGNFPNVVRDIIRGVKTLLDKTKKDEEQEKRDLNP